MRTHTQEYISHYREWDTAVQSLKTLCPIDRNKESEEDGSKDNNNVHRTRRQSDAARGHDHPPLAQAIMLNGRRVLLCNFNGVTFQVVVDQQLYMYKHTYTEVKVQECIFMCFYFSPYCVGRFLLKVMTVMMTGCS